MATTVVATAFPDLVLAPGQTITVDTGDPLATISLLNVFGVTPAATADIVEAPVAPLLAYQPTDATG
jgi:hypothetical protein